MSLAFSWCAGPAALVGMPLPPAVAVAHRAVTLPPAKVSPASAPASAPPVASVTMPPAAVWLALARRALATESYGEALRCFDGAVKHEPRLALAHLGRAVCLLNLERETEAEESLATIFDVARGQEEILYHLARMCAREGRVGIGVALLTEAVKAIPALEEKIAADPLFADHPAYLMAIGRL